MKTLRLEIAGRVQGVGYREWMLAEAARRGIAGWVRNRRDGTVEAVVHGPAEAVDALMAACRQGPRAAEVSGIRASPAQPPIGPGFRRFPSA